MSRISWGQVIEKDWSLGWPGPLAQPIWRARCLGWHYQGRRRQPEAGFVPSRNRDDELWKFWLVESMGSTGRATPSYSIGFGSMARSSKQTLRHKCLISCSFARCLSNCRLSRYRRDVVPMMPWSGPSLTSVKHAYETGPSGLHRTSIMLAAW